MFPQRPVRVVFMGSDELSIPFLETLCASPEIEVACVVTQPDRPSGRGMRVTTGPVKALALAHEIPVLTPVNVNDDFVLETLFGLGIDLVVVMAYGQILHEMLLDLPPMGCINLHVSLLPRWRGAAPIQRAILAGDTETGITSMRMDRGLDTGNILLQAKTAVDPKDTTASLGARLVEMGRGVMMDTIRRLRDDPSWTGTRQNHELRTYAHKIQRADTTLDWSLSAAENERRVRAFYPKPGAATFVPGQNGKRGMLLKVLAAEVETLPHGMALAVPGTLLELDQKKGPLVAGGHGKALRLVEVLPEGGRAPMPGGSFANGYRSRIPIGTRLEPIPAK